MKKKITLDYRESSNNSALFQVINFNWQLGRIFSINAIRYDNSNIANIVCDFSNRNAKISIERKQDKHYYNSVETRQIITIAFIPGKLKRISTRYFQARMKC